MITLTKLDGNIITLNSDLIESVDTIHDSTITMLNGKKIIVKENYKEIIEKTINYKRQCFEKVYIKTNE